MLLAFKVRVLPTVRPLKGSDMSVKLGWVLMSMAAVIESPAKESVETVRAPLPTMLRFCSPAGGEGCTRFAGTVPMSAQFLLLPCRRWEVGGGRWEGIAEQSHHNARMM